MESYESHILPHGPLVELAPNLWQITGRLPKGDLPRNMIIHRLADGKLVIHSAIALDKKTREKVEALGEMKYLIVPNRFHRLDAAVYRERYPDITVVAPRACVAHVEKKVRVDGAAEDLLPPVGVRVHVPQGVRASELVYDVDCGGARALVVCDLLFNLDHQRGLMGRLFRTIGSTGFFGMTKIGKLFLLQNKEKFRVWLETIAQTIAPRVVCVGHGHAVVHATPDALRAAARRL